MSTATSLPISPWAPKLTEHHTPEILFKIMEMRFAPICTRIKVKRNTVICNQGSTISCLYLVKKGKVLLNRLSSDGREILLAILGPGEFFGEGSLLSGAEVPYSATATKRSELLQLPERQFKLLLEDLHTCHILMKTISQRCSDAWTQMEVMSCARARDKIRSGLLWLSGKKGVETQEGVRIDLNQTQLACMMGCARETLNRNISELKRLRAIDVRHSNGRKSLFVVDPEVLA
jgi:CRP/FNR family cyclic AMP-dependent transcriptional regulator